MHAMNNLFMEDAINNWSEDVFLEYPVLVISVAIIMAVV